MSEFNIGDKVYLEGKISEYDEKDNTYCVDYSDYHKFTHTSCWIKDDVLYPADEDYNKGLNDAWELAKKIVLPRRDGGYSWQKFERIFDYRDYDSVLKAFTPQEALAKVKEYEERDEIKVRDVVKLKGLSCKAIVTRVTETNIYLLFKDGSCAFRCYKEGFEKTDEHFDSIDEFMKQED